MKNHIFEKVLNFADESNFSIGNKDELLEAGRVALWLLEFSWQSGLLLVTSEKMNCRTPIYSASKALKIWDFSYVMAGADKITELKAQATFTISYSEYFTAPPAAVTLR